MKRTEEDLERPDPIFLGDELPRQCQRLGGALPHQYAVAGPHNGGEIDRGNVRPDARYVGRSLHASLNKISAGRVPSRR
jgi:hypothetical protein